MKESYGGKKILITGSTDGLGKLIARHLAEQGAEVLLHGRNEAKGERVMEEIKDLCPDSSLKYYNADYSSLEEVNSLSLKIHKEHDHLDILINNAAIGKGLPNNNHRELSKEGIELRFAVNYLAHVLLTEKLLPVLKSDTSLIINVASVGQAPLDFDNLMLDHHYDGFLAYRQSKTALIMYTFDLAERLKETGVKVNAVHPASLMNTKMVLDDWGYSLTTVEQGAETVENLLDTVVTGAYFDGKKQSGAIEQTYDQKARAKLKEITWNLLDKYL